MTFYQLTNQKISCKCFGAVVKWMLLSVVSTTIRYTRFHWLIYKLKRSWQEVTRTCLKRGCVRSFNERRKQTKSEKKGLILPRLVARPIKRCPALTFLSPTLFAHFINDLAINFKVLNKGVQIDKCNLSSFVCRWYCPYFILRKWYAGHIESLDNWCRKWRIQINSQKYKLSF